MNGNKMKLKHAVSCLLALGLVAVILVGCATAHSKISRADAEKIALAKVPGGGSVTISYLLPPFARLRLYTFANPATDPAAARENCYWTAMNFFNETPDPRFLDLGTTVQVLATDYLKTESLPTYGDLIALNDGAGELIHLCVYLADGVVFTKNGSDYLQPWVLMKIPDMMKYYSAKKSVKLTVYRAKVS